MSLPNEQDDDFECEVEEDNLGIGILTDESLALIEEVEDVDDVRLVDESGEVSGEFLFLLRHVVSSSLRKLYIKLSLTMWLK